MHAHASLNRAYRLVWNAALGAVVAAPETARGAGAPGTGPAGAAFPLRRFVVAMALALGAPAGWAVDPAALPREGSLAAGSASWSTSGSTLTVNQSSPRAIVNWQSFDVGSGATVRFVQPSASSVILNRVTGGAASAVDGALSANGQVYLVNPAGVLFGKTAQVDVGGLTASTLGLSDEDFLAGRDRFTRDGSTGSVVNEGRISVQPGGRVVLLGARVDNRGQIFAPGGDVALAAGQQVTLGVGANGHLQVSVDAADVATLVANGGLVQADGGQIVLTARGADALASAVVANTGTLQARTVAAQDGRILLLADMEHGTAQVGGTLDASAPAGGNGGFVETSGAHVAIAPGTRVNTLAASGRTGTWLIDPQDITIVAGTPASADEISAADIQSSLQTSNVTIATSASGSGAGDINVRADLAWSAQTLTLTAHNDIDIDAVMTASGTAGLALNYGGNGGVSGAAPAAGSGIATGQRGRVDFTGTGNTLAINGDAYTIITSLGASGSTTGTDLQGINGNLSGRYALGADIDASATSGWASGAGFAPIGDPTTKFTGTFEGLGHTVNTMTINRTSSSNVGLFGSIGSGGTVRNLTVANANVSGSSTVGIVVGGNDGSLSNVGAQGSVFGGNFVGGLAGGNNGTIARAWANATVYSVGSYTGGLAGSNASTGVIDRSWANTAMSVENLYAGGLVGLNGAVITDSYATGSITAVGGAVGSVGGLVGRAIPGGSIARSYTDVQLPSITTAGGVLGTGSATLNDVYWDSTRTGAATGNGSGAAAGTALTSAQLESGLPANFAGTTWGNAGNRSTPYLLANAGPVRLSTDASGAHYQIVLDAAQLQAMVTSARAGGLAGNYALGNDIDASVTRGWNGGTGFMSVGGSGPTTGYKGTFDGLGYTITGLFMDRPTSAGGLFGGSQGGNVRDLTIAAADIRTNASAGVLAAGWSSGTIARVNVSGSVQALSIVGGLVGGLGAGGVIEDSHADVDVSGQSTGTVRAGGLAGLNQGTIRRSSASGAVDGSGSMVGGLVGHNSSGTIEDSWASGAVHSSGTGTGYGGLVGNTGGTIARSYATGSVTGDGNEFGGLAGTVASTGSITQSWASGDVTQGGSGSTAGGLVGSNLGAVTDAFALGNVQGSAPAAVAGGLVGRNMGTVARTYATGTVIGGTAGGLVGENLATVSGSVWNGDANAAGFGTNTGTVSGSSGQGAAALRQLSTYAALGWDIDAAGGTGTTWRIYEGSTTPWLRTFLAPVTVTVNGDLGGKVYDGSVASGAVAPANTTVSDPAAVLSGTLGYTTTGKNAATYSSSAGTLRIGGLYSGPAGYDIAYSGASTATITPKAITGTITAADKVYDGNTAAVTSGSLAGVVAGDTVTLSASGSFDTKDAGTGKTVTFSGVTVGGAEAGNYTVSANATAAADITPKAITGTVTATDKVYDGNTSATTSGSLSGVLAGDDVTLASTGTFDTRNAGTGKTVTISGTGLGGADGGNYTVTTNTTTTAAITPKAITGTITAADKVYDGNTSAGTSGVLAGVIGGDTVTLSATGTFDTKDAGTGKTVTLSGVTVGGTEAGNYTVTSNATTTAAITPKAITGTITASDKVYDGNTSAGTSGVLAGVIGGDTVTLSATGTFDTKDAGTGKTVTLSGVTVGGVDAGNYTVTSNATTTAAITPKAITGTITASDKVYDGNTSAGTSGSLAGVIGGDTVTLSATGTFDTKDAGTGKTVTLSGVSVGGADAANYTVTANATTTAAITPKAITGTVTATDKVYDGNTSATTSGSLSGVLAGDDVTLASTGTFDSRNVGTGKTVAISGTSLGGADGGNYTVTTNATTTADITPKAITGSITAAGKVYDGTTDANTSGSLAGLVAGDAVTLATSGTFADRDAGTGKTVNVAGSLAGADAGNYVLAANTTATADIARAPLVVSANDAVKLADGVPYAGGNGVRYDGFVGAEGDWVLGGNLLWGGSAQGALQPGQYRIAVSGLLSTNYDISYRDGLLAIVPAQGVPAPGDVERRAWLALTARTAPDPALAPSRVPLAIAPDFVRLPE